MKVVFFTVCNLTYLPKAIVLAKSLYSIQQTRLVIYLFDEKKEQIPADKSYDIRWVSDQKIPNFKHIAFMYDVTEACTAVKPYLTLQLIESSDAVIYLDPDICVYSDFNDLYKLLEKYPIILTPHYIVPIDDPQQDYDIGMMRWGSFNLGFYAVNKSEEGIKFLNWWSERCINLGFAESQFGLSVDQKWVSIAPCFFENIKVLFDQGYNMAFWNIQERQLNRLDDTYFVNNNSKLKFFHFSSFDSNNPKIISTRPHKWNKSGREDLDSICVEYSIKLKENDFGFSKFKYAYDYMSNGDYISPVLRRAYASVYKELVPDHDPFDASGPIGKFIKRNHLRVHNNTSFKPLNESNLVNYNWQFNMVIFTMRLLLRLFGPNMFGNYSRLFIYLSSYRKNRKLWKL